MNKWQNGRLRTVWSPAGVHANNSDARYARLPFDVLNWQEPGASVTSEWVVSPPADANFVVGQYAMGDILDEGYASQFGFYDWERYLLEPNQVGKGAGDSVQDLHFFGPV